MKRFFIRIAILLGVPLLLAVAVNLFRPTSLDWIAKEAYEIFQDCPEATAQAEEVQVEFVRSHATSLLWVDARSEELFAVKHLPGAVNVVYDTLFPVAEEDLHNLQSISKGKTVVVYGEGGIGKLLADDLASQGMVGVKYLNPQFDWKTLLMGEMP